MHYWQAKQERKVINFEKWYTSYRYSQWTFIWQYTQGFMNPTHPTPKSRKVKQMLNISTNIANSSTVPRIESLNSTVLEMTDWLERQVEDAIGGKQEHLGCALCFMCNFNSVSVLCVYPHCKVSIGQYTKMCTSSLIFSPAPLFQMTKIWRKYLITFTSIVYLVL